MVANKDYGGFDSAALSAVNGGLWSSFNGSFATTKIPNSVPSENVLFISDHLHFVTSTKP